MMAAFAVGWELLIRLGLSDPGGLQRRGFQVTPAAGVFAAAAVSCLLSGDDVEKSARALSIAGSMASGTLAPAKRGDSTKAVQPGWAAHSGIMAAELARVGITGPDDVFHGSMGFFSLYGGVDRSRDFEQMIEDIGTIWHLPDAAFKMFPCCHYIHPFIEAAQLLKSDIADSEITRVHCHVPEAVVPVVAEPWDQRVAPQTTQEARWSLPYVVATAFVDEKVDLETFRGEMRDDIITFAQHIDYEAWCDSGFPRVFPAKVEVTLSDGSVRSCFIEDVLGNRDRPFTEEDVKVKARANLTSVGLSSHRIDSIVGLLTVDRGKSIQEFSKLLEVQIE
jgi:2-methylcitrate dehydratase PrpD